MQSNWKRKFFAIAIGQAASLIGSSAVQFALIWWLAGETGSAVMMGFSGLAAFLPMALLSPVAGIAADRYDRRRICIMADLFIGLVAAVFALLLWRFSLPPQTALLILFFRGIGDTFHQPSLQALMPQLVPADALLKVGGWNQMIASGSFLLGPALGAALYAAFPLPVLLLTDLAGAVIASLMLLLTPVPPLARAPQPQGQKRNPTAELREGLQVYKSDKQLLCVLIVNTVSMVFYLPLSSFYPLMTSRYFAASAWHGSAVEIAYALGMMVVALLFSSVIRVKRHLLVSYAGLLGGGLCAVICGLLPPTMWAWAVFAVTCGVMGGFGNVYSIPLVAYMQTTIAPERMGRAFSVLSMAASVAMPAGLLLGSPLAEWLGVHRWFFIAGAGMLAVALAGLFAHAALGRNKS